MTFDSNYKVSGSLPTFPWFFFSVFSPIQSFLPFTCFQALTSSFQGSICMSALTVEIYRKSQNFESVYRLIKKGCDLLQMNLTSKVFRLSRALSIIMIHEHVRIL